MVFVAIWLYIILGKGMNFFLRKFLVVACLTKATGFATATINKNDRAFAIPVTMLAEKLVVLNVKIK